MNLKIMLLASVITGALTGCGGGGSSSGNTSLTLNGTAATGLAISRASISAKCQAGTGTATTNADGTFTLTITDGALPCVLRVTGTNNTVLHSMIAGSGSSATVNITPLSDMMVARLAGKLPEDFFNAFDASKVNATTVADAQQAVVKSLKDVVDLNGMDLLSDNLQAASGGGATGNAFDQKLDTLKTKLTAAGTSLATIVQALVDNNDASTDGAGSVVATLLQPPAATCTALRSGSYRLITPSQTDPAWQANLVALDAQTGIYTYHDGSTGTATPVSNSSCEFSGSNGLSRFYYSKSGIVVVNNGGVTPRRISFGFPDQPLTLSDLAGTWNEVAFKRATQNDPFIFSHGTIAVTADGSTTKTDCQQAITQAGCGAAAADGTFAVASSGGGFNFAPLAGDMTSRRAFAFRAPNGNMVLAMLEPNNNGWTIATKHGVTTLPPVGNVANYWSMDVSSSNVANAAVSTTTTITAVNTANNTYTRRFASDNHVDTLALNTPYTGMTYRAPGTSVGDNGTVTISEYIAMSLSGMGVSVYGKPVANNTSFFGVRVDKP